MPFLGIARDAVARFSRPPATQSFRNSCERNRVLALWRLPRLFLDLAEVYFMHFRDTNCTNYRECWSEIRSDSFVSIREIRSILLHRSNPPPSLSRSLPRRFLSTPRTCRCPDKNRNRRVDYRRSRNKQNLPRPRWRADALGPGRRRTRHRFQLRSSRPYRELFRDPTPRDRALIRWSANDTGKAICLLEC